MSKKLIEAAKLLYSNRKKNSSKNSKSNSSQKSLERQFLQSSPFVPFIFPQVEILLSIIQKQIVNPINLHTEIFNTDHSQKCLVHNHAMTLYCVNDHRPLCAMCMYQNNMHKIHKVIPINKANELLESEIKEFLRIIQTNLRTQNLVMKKNDLNLITAEKDYPELLERLHKFYLKLQQIIIDKKNEQFKILHNSWSKIRQLNSTMKTEIYQINQYTLQKIKQINQRRGEEYALFNFNVAFELTKLQNIIHQHLCQEQKNNCFIQQRKFQQIQEIITKSLIFNEIKSKALETDISNLQISRKRSRQVLNQQKSGKSLIASHEHITNQQSKQYNNKKLSPKNRHGKSEIQSTMELQQQKRMFQDKLIRHQQEPFPLSKSNVSLSTNKQLRTKSSLKPNYKTTMKK